MVVDCDPGPRYHSTMTLSHLPRERPFNMNHFPLLEQAASSEPALAEVDRGTPQLRFHIAHTGVSAG